MEIDEFVDVPLDSSGVVNSSGASLSYSEDSFVIKGTDKKVDSVSISLTPFDPGTPEELDYFPGEFRGLTEEGEIVDFESFSFMKIITENNGTEVDLAPGKEAKVEFPISEALEEDAPSQIPLWYFDPDVNEWIKDGYADKICSEDECIYRGNITTIASWWNCDDITTISFIEGILKLIDFDGSLSKLFEIVYEGVDYRGRSIEFFNSFTNDGISLSGRVREDSKVNVYLRYGSYQTRPIILRTKEVQETKEINEYLELDPKTCLDLSNPSWCLIDFIELVDEYYDLFEEDIKKVEKQFTENQKERFELINTLNEALGQGDIDGCSDLSPSNFQKCVYNFAVIGDISLCGRTNSPINCIIEADKDKDIELIKSVCNEESNIALRGNCYHEVAMHRTKVDLCSYLADSMVYSCILDVDKDKEILLDDLKKVCENVSSVAGSTFKKRCFHHIAVHRDEISLCSYAGSGADNCVIEIDKNKNHPIDKLEKICKNLGGYTRTHCFRNVALHRDEISFCSYLTHSAGPCLNDINENKNYPIDKLENVCENLETDSRSIKDSCINAVNS